MKKSSTKKTNYSVSTTKKGSPKGTTPGYTKLKGGGIKSKKTGKVYTGKEATLAARKRRVKFSHMKGK